MIINFEEAKNRLLQTKKRKSVEETFSQLDENAVVLSAIMKATGLTVINGIDYCLEKERCDREFDKAFENANKLLYLKEDK